MTISECHYDFKMKMDRIDSLSNPDFNKAEIDWLLNAAALLFLKRKVDPNNSRNRGFEADQKRIDDLSTLVVKYPVQPGITPIEDSGIYELDLSLLAFTYYRLISAQADVLISEDCIKRIPLKFMQHDDYLDALRDPFNKPNLSYIPYNIGRSSQSTNSSLYIYPGDYDITLVYPEYIKYPRKVSYGNYTYIDGVVYPPTTFDFPEHTHPEIVDIACQIASFAIENPEYVQLKTQQVFNND